MNNEQQTQQADDPSGPGWRDVEPDELLRHGDLFWNVDHWQATQHAGQPAVDERTYRRRIEPQQPSDSEPETMEDLRTRLAACEVLLAEAGGSGQQVNAELQQLREQVRDLTRQAQLDAVELQQLREQLATLMVNYDRTKTQLWDAVEARQKAERELATETKCYRDSFKASHKAGQQQVLEELQKWMRPVLEVVADHPDHSSILAVSVLEFLPQIASRLIEE